LDSDGDYTTTLVSEGEECAFVFLMRRILRNVLLNKLFRWENRLEKPISCHLYPIRIKEYKEYDAVNYHSWHICKPACECGQQLNVPVYKFLKEPLIRKYGDAWYEELDAVYQAYSSKKRNRFQ